MEIMGHENGNSYWTEFTYMGESQRTLFQTDLNAQNFEVHSENGIIRVM